ncbi:hypothetical protein ACFLZ6_00640 [Nanoarchaeota archaeon]
MEEQESQQEEQENSTLKRVGGVALKAAAKSPGYTAAGLGLVYIYYQLEIYRVKAREFLEDEFVQDRAKILQHTADLNTEASEVAELVIDNLAQSLSLPRMDTLNNRLVDQYNGIVSELETEAQQLREFPGKIGDYSEKMQHTHESLQKARTVLESIIENERNFISQVEDTLESFDQLYVDYTTTARHVGQKVGIDSFIMKLSKLRQYLQGQDEKYLDQFVARIEDLTEQKESIQEIKQQVDQLRSSVQDHKQSVKEAEQLRQVYIESGLLYKELVDLKKKTRSYSPHEYNKEVQALIGGHLDSIMAGAENEVRQQVAIALRTGLEQREQHYQSLAKLYSQKWVARADTALFGAALIAATAVVLAAPYVNTLGKAAISVGKLGVGAAKGLYQAGTYIAGLCSSKNKEKDCSV